jgi:integrase
MRLGEVRALRWADINWARGTVTVRRSYSWGEESTPKSGKVRSIALPDQAAAALDLLSRRGDFTDPDDLVFVSPTGSYMEDSALRRRFDSALADADLPRIRLHDLRHTFGTVAIQALPPSKVQSIMGHASILTTQIYIHHTPRVESARKLSEMFNTDDLGDVRRTRGL